MSVALYILAAFSLLVALGLDDDAASRNGWLVASGLYALAGAMA